MTLARGEVKNRVVLKLKVILQSYMEPIKTISSSMIAFKKDKVTSRIVKIQAPIDDDEEESDEESSGSDSEISTAVAVKAVVVVVVVVVLANLVRSVSVTT
jgi:hypothetical protein